MPSDLETENDQAAKIRERAYHIWLDEGQPNGQDLEHWAQAEQEIVKGAGVQDKVETIKKPAPNGKSMKK